MADSVGQVGAGTSSGTVTADQAADSLSASFDKAIAIQQQLQQVTLEKSPLLDSAKEKIK
jgi:hypothetical protein